MSLPVTAPTGASRPVAPPSRPAAPGPRPAAPAPRLRVAPPEVPHGRLGVIWAGVTAVAVALGRWSLAAWLGAGALVAVLALGRAWGQRPAAILPGLIAALALPVAAAAGTVAFGIATLLVLALLAARAGAKLPAEPARLIAPLMAGLALGLSSASLVLMGAHSLTVVCLVLALAACHDASRYLVGWGAPSRWEGPAAGLAALASATLVVAVVEPSPLHGAYPWLLGAVVAAGGLAGRPLCRLLEAPPQPVSTRPGRRPRGGPSGPLRRFSTLLTAAPVFLLVVALGHL